LLIRLLLGPKRRVEAITKTGDIHARTLLIEAAHSYRFPARVARHKLAAVDAVPEVVRAIAWKAQTRLCQRYRHIGERQAEAGRGHRDRA
jgi:transposase